MSQAILYSKSPCSLKSIAHSTCPSGISQEAYEHLLLNSNNRAVNIDSMMVKNKPVYLSAQDTQKQRVTNLHRIEACTREEQEVLSNLSLYAGGNAVMGLASLLWDTKIPDIVGDLNTFGGNGMGAAVAKSSNLMGAIDNYDKALKEFEDLKNHRAAPRSIRGAKIRVESAFRAMNEEFSRMSSSYLNRSSNKMMDKAQFGMRTSSNARGKQIWQSIPVSDNADIQKLAKLAKVGRAAGPGFIVLDGYIRLSNVNNMKKENNPAWKREAFVQGASFAVGIAAGAAIGAVLVPTIAGLAIAIVAAGAVALFVDYAARTIFGALWDLVTE